MDFGWTVDQEARYAQALAFARERLATAARTGGRNEPFTRSEWRMCSELGLTGLCLPSRHGGGECGALTTARVLSALGRGGADIGLGFSLAVHLLGCGRPLAEHGSAALQERILRRLCSGEWIGAVAMSEAQAGSDVSAIQTRAERDGGAYVLTGTKTYVTNGPLADAVIVFATTEPAHGVLGITAFLVERTMHGVAPGGAAPAVGLARSPAGTIVFDGCRVPAENVIGREGQGPAVFASAMRWERACLFALYLGMLERQLDETIAHARKRLQFGKPLGKQQSVAHRIADMKQRLDAAELLLYRACWQIDRGEPAQLEVSLAKLAVSEAAIRSSLDAIQLHGANALGADSDVARYLLDSLPSTIASGTSEMQRTIIASELGL